MTAKPDIRRIALGILTPMFEAIGFRKRERGIFTIDLGDEFLGWIGLPDAVRKGEIAINPVIGLRHQGAQELIAHFTDRKLHSYIPPTVTTALGFLLPEQKWREWYFDSSHLTEDYQGLANIIRDVALPFMREHANLASLKMMLEEYKYVKFRMDQHERLPIIECLQGDFAGAIASAEQYSGEVREGGDQRSHEYRTKYVPKLIEYCRTIQERG